MRRSRIAIFAIALLLAAAGWFLLRSAKESKPTAAPGAGASAQLPPAWRSADPVAPKRASSPAHRADGSAAAADRSTLADALNSPTTDINADLRIVADVLGAFRTNFRALGNPTGSNAEITAALTGNNSLKLALIPADHPAVNRDGELCDRWGTPFFFHAESAQRMEIRSAGADRKLWTDDDVTFAP